MTLMRERMTDTLRLPLDWVPLRQQAQEYLPPDRLLLTMTYVLALVGLVMVLSASGVMAEEKHGDPTHFLKRQAVWLMLGLLVLHIVSRIDYHLWQDVSPLLIGLVLFLLVLVPFIGLKGNGAQRWLQIGVFSLQPAEIAKIGVVCYLASYLARKESRIALFLSGFCPPLFVVGLLAGLVLIQPDMGTAVVLFLLLFALLFLSGAKIGHLLAVAMLVIPIGVALIFSAEYRLKRLLSFLDPWQDYATTGFQLCQSFMALGSGGIFGVGLGESKQKLFFLPEAHTDFVLAVIGEELGLLGTAAMMGLFAMFVLRGFHIAGRAPDVFGRHLACGVTLLIGIQALINAGVVAGLLPTKGLTLPLVSYGGSSLVMTLLSIGMLLNVSRQRAPTTS
ncbi:MAG: putative lipid II flippase FtsW [Nitrospirales bacterium]|nr:putative lipid II flippase FtsW [Nitrospirales bacterium]